MKGRSIHIKLPSGGHARVYEDGDVVIDILAHTKTILTQPDIYEIQKNYKLFALEDRDKGSSLASQIGDIEDGNVIGR